MRRIAVRGPGRVTVATVALAVGGGAAGLLIAWSSEHRPSTAWATWTLVVVAMSSASGASFVYGAGRWRLLTDIGSVRARDVAASVGGMWLTAALFGVVFQAVSLPSSGKWEWRAGLLILIAGIGVLPSTSVIVAGRVVVADLTGGAGARYDLLVDIRRMLQGVLLVLGAIIALLVISATTAARMAGKPVVVDGVLFGAFMSALVGTVYLPTSAILRSRGIRLAAEIMPTNGLTGMALAERIEQRAKLEALLGVDKTIFSDFQTNLVVLAPLITGLATAFLPKTV
jgi:hypothetical protein